MIFSCYLVKLNYHYTLRDKGEADAISVSHLILGQYPHPTEKRKKIGGRPLFLVQWLRGKNGSEHEKKLSHVYVLIFPFQGFSGKKEESLLHL